MHRHVFLVLVGGLVCAGQARAQSLRVSFDDGFKAGCAVGRAEPWVFKGAELVPGKFGKAARVKAGALIYAADRNLQAGRGTLAFWCKVPELPGPHDVQRLIFVQCKERGYWTCLATMEWQESVFRAKVFDFYHGHGWDDLDGLKSFKPEQWHHLALVWDQAHGSKFFLNGKLLGSTWGMQAWWDRPTPHAIHLCYPGADYDELCVYERPLSDKQVADLAATNQWQVKDEAVAWDAKARERLQQALSGVGLDNLPVVKAGQAGTAIRQARVKRILDDRIPSWKVMDGRMNLFWPEWRAPTLGDVDFSGSQIRVDFEPGQKLSHLVLRGLVGGCKIHGERQGYVSKKSIVSVPQGMHFLAAATLPEGLTGLRVPRNEGMKLHEIGVFEVGAIAAEPKARIATSISGTLELSGLEALGENLLTRTAPGERLVFGQIGQGKPLLESALVTALGRFHFVTNPVKDVTPLTAVRVRVPFTADWKESVWLVRVQDPVNPRRDLINVPVRVLNPKPNSDTAFDVVLDFWDIMLDAGARLWVEIQPMDDVQLQLSIRGKHEGMIELHHGDRAKVLKEFAHTQSQLAFSYWQLGSEGGGTAGSDPTKPGFALLGHITHNYEFKLTLEWVRRHVPDHPLTNGLWGITFGKEKLGPFEPRLSPKNAPAWAVWGRELHERFRAMAHHWADAQGPDGQVGGGWNDDTDFPGVFICLPLLGDTKTQKMFERIFDGLEKTGYLKNGVSRAPIDSLHATDFLSWRAHLILFDYGQPRHSERALALAKELHKWTKLDAKGQRHFVTGFYSEDGPGYHPTTEVGDGGLIEGTGAGKDSGTNRNFLRDLIFYAWYSRNPAVLKFIREVAEGDYAAAAAGAKLGSYQTYPFFSYATLFGDDKYLQGPLGASLADRWNLPMWRRYLERVPGGNKGDDKLLKGAAAKSPLEETLVTAYLIKRDKDYLVRALRQACEKLQAGWQFRGGAALGANDHFSVPGLSALSQMYLGGAMTWLRPASILPPIAVSWQDLGTDVAALVLEAGAKKLRVAAYNFADKPRKVRMRLWELGPGQYELREGADADQDDRIDQPVARKVAVRRATALDILLPPGRVYMVELDQATSEARPEYLPDLAVGVGDAFYDKATDRLKVVVHNIGSAAAKNVVVRFESPDGKVLGQKIIANLDAPLDLEAKTAVVWLGQPLMHPYPSITVRVDPDGAVDEITVANNQIVWHR